LVTVHMHSKHPSNQAEPEPHGEELRRSSDSALRDNSKGKDRQMAYVPNPSQIK